MREEQEKGEGKCFMMEEMKNSPEKWKTKTWSDQDRRRNKPIGREEIIFAFVWPTTNASAKQKQQRQINWNQSEWGKKLIGESIKSLEAQFWMHSHKCSGEIARWSNRVPEMCSYFVLYSQISHTQYTYIHYIRLTNCSSFGIPANIRQRM